MANLRLFKSHNLNFEVHHSLLSKLPTKVLHQLCADAGIEVDHHNPAFDPAFELAYNGAVEAVAFSVIIKKFTQQTQEHGK